MTNDELINETFGSFYNFLCNFENQDLASIDENGMYFLIDRSNWESPGASEDRVFAMFDSTEAGHIFNTLPEIIERCPSACAVELYYVGQPPHIPLPRLPRNVEVMLLPLHHAWKLRWSVVTGDDAVGRYVRSTMAMELSSHLNALNTGNGTAYEDLVYDIFYFTALPFFSSLYKQIPTADGIRRRDIVAELMYGSQLQQCIINERLRANQVIIEAKNEQRNSGANIVSAQKYLGPSSPASVGFLITRGAFSTDLRQQCALERMKWQGRFLIIAMCDDDLHLMLNAARQNRIDDVQQLLIDRMMQSLRDCH